MATFTSTSPLHPQAQPFNDKQTAELESQGISAIRIDYGPRDLLGRFFLMADHALHNMGISLSFGTFEELVATNLSNRDSWFPLVPLYDPRNGLCAPTTSYVLIGRNAHGQIVTAQGAHIFNWQHTNFKTEAESLRLFYASPETMARPGEACLVTAPSASQLTNTVAFLGGAWWHPSVRGHFLGRLLARISRAYAFTRWHPDLTLALMSEKLIAKGFPLRNGYQHIELGVGFRNFELGDIDLGMVWITAGELFHELSAFTSTLEIELRRDGSVRTA